MTDKPQVNVRLTPELYREFERKLKAGGWTKTSLLSKLVKDFVTSPTVAEEPFNYYSQTSSSSQIIRNLHHELEFLSLQIKELNQKLEQRLETFEQKLDSLSPTVNSQQQPTNNKTSQLKIVPLDKSQNG